MKLLTEAFIIMTLGMTVTFAFLGVVIGAVSLIARLTHWIEGAPVDEAERPSGGGNQAADRTRLVAIIAAALHGGRAS
jgi:sodium pump decarboxylase gamma subunit